MISCTSMKFTHGFSPEWEEAVVFLSPAWATLAESSQA